MKQELECRQRLCSHRSEHKKGSSTPHMEETEAGTTRTRASSVGIEEFTTAVFNATLRAVEARKVEQFGISATIGIRYQFAGSGELAAESAAAPSAGAASATAESGTALSSSAGIEDITAAVFSATLRAVETRRLISGPLTIGIIADPTVLQREQIQ